MARRQASGGAALIRAPAARILSRVKTRTLGRTGLAVSELAFGGLFVASFASPLERARQTVDRALDLGITYLDTAPTYGDSEQVLGAVLADERRPFILSTKLSGKAPGYRTRDKAFLRGEFERSLGHLRRDRVDILMIHEPDRPGQLDWWSDPAGVGGPVLELLDELKREGLVRFTGIGGTTSHELARLVDTGKFDVVLTAYNYSLLWREAALEIFPAAKAHGTGIVLGSPLQQQALSRRYDEQVERGAPWLSKSRRAQFKALYRFLDETGLDIAECGIRFVLSNPDVSCALVGAASPEEVEKNVATVAKGPLPRDVQARLDEIAAMVPFRPYEEPAGLGWILAASGSHWGPGVAR
jgi:aryl-alcohol dehydrogenase-like predicted oxidoreductase